MKTTITEAELLQAKAKYGSIGTIEIEKQTYYYRSLTPYELSAIQTLETSLPTKDWAQAIVNIATIFPADPDFELPGSMYTLQDMIMRISVPIMDNGEFNLDEYRAWADEIIKTNAAYALAVAVANQYPAINVLDLLNMPMEKLMQTAALMEKIIGRNLFGGETSSKSDPADALRKAIMDGKKQKK
ncbi:hypothetical protein [Acinetobacter sp.]|uniref:hypothetical protein n=1 Tax=Acinetobacter sp. TaxID=472 RepID=UPI003CFCB64E